MGGGASSRAANNAMGTAVLAGAAGQLAGTSFEEVPNYGNGGLLGWFLNWFTPDVPLDISLEEFPAGEEREPVWPGYEAEQSRVDIESYPVSDDYVGTQAGF